MAAVFCPLCTSKVIWQPVGQQKLHGTFCQGAFYQSLRKNNQINHPVKDAKFSVLASNKGTAKSGESEEAFPSWARPDADEPPPWVRNESAPNELKEGFEFPFFVYLLASAVTAIAAIGSIFEYVNQRPVFGVVNPDSIFYAPLLGFFTFTGIPTSAFLWFKSVQVANKEAEEQDRRDGFR